MKFYCRLVTVFLLSGVLSPGFAQQALYGDIKSQADILSSVLMEGLELNNTPNLFGINSGRINAFYLKGQGVVFEIQTPLANQRTRANLNALAFSIRDMSGRINPFEFAARSETTAATREMSASIAQDNVSGFYQNIIEEIDALDFDSILDDSIRAAGASARSLFELGALNQTDFNSLRNEVNDLQSRVEAAIADAGVLRARLLSEDEALSTQAQAEVRESLGNMRQLFDDLSQLASNKAAELEQRYRLAQEQYRVRWQEQVLQFELRIYQLLCDYGSTLRDLPDGEFLSVVLNNLGDEAAEGELMDRVHVISKADLLACQAGSFDASALGQRAEKYSY